LTDRPDYSKSSRFGNPLAVAGRYQRRCAVAHRTNTVMSDRKPDELTPKRHRPQMHATTTQGKIPWLTR
jgi:hypothetical protein